MKCLNPNCNYYKTKALDSCDLKKGNLTRRRRYCFKCQTRYTTLEIPIYIGRVNRDRRYVLQEMITYFSKNNSCDQWKQFLDNST